MFGSVKKFFGKPIRKVKHAAIVGAIVPVLMFTDAHFELGLGEALTREIGAGIATTLLIWLPIVQSYVSKSGSGDISA